MYRHDRKRIYDLQTLQYIVAAIASVSGGTANSQQAGAKVLEYINLLLVNKRNFHIIEHFSIFVLFLSTILRRPIHFEAPRVCTRLTLQGINKTEAFCLFALYVPDKRTQFNPGAPSSESNVDPKSASKKQIFWANTNKSSDVRTFYIQSTY